MAKEVAIITPVYNGHGLVLDLLTSINIQTIRDACKVFLIVDGDGEKYDYLISSFPLLNIEIVYMKENGGPGTARNRGIELTIQENIPYIIFADQDDEFYGCYAIQFLLNSIKEYNVNMVRSPIISQAFNKLFFQEENGNLLFGKIYKTSIIKDNNISFYPLHFEDGCFNLTYMLSDKFSICDFPYLTYLWKDNPTSICRKDNGKFCQETFVLDFINLIETYEKLIEKEDSDKTLILATVLDRLAYFYNIYKQWEPLLEDRKNYNRKIQLSRHFYRLVEYFPILTSEQWWEQRNSAPYIHELYIFYVRGAYE